MATGVFCPDVEVIVIAVKLLHGTRYSKGCNTKVSQVPRNGEIVHVMANVTARHGPSAPTALGSLVIRQF